MANMKCTPSKYRRNNGILQFNFIYYQWTNLGQYMFSIVIKCTLFQLGNIMKLEHDIQGWTNGETNKWKDIIKDIDVNWEWILE